YAPGRVPDGAGTGRGGRKRGRPTDSPASAGLSDPADGCRGLRGDQHVRLCPAAWQIGGVDLVRVVLPRGRCHGYSSRGEAASRCPFVRAGTRLERGGRTLALSWS